MRKKETVLLTPYGSIFGPNEQLCSKRSIPLKNNNEKNLIALNAFSEVSASVKCHVMNNIASKYTKVN